MAENRQT